MEDIQEKLKAVEAQMQAPDFWADKERAQVIIREYEGLKDAAAGKEKFDRSDALISILAGAGGTDAEDFAHLLAEMYWKYCEAKGWAYRLIHENHNDHGGYRNITFEVTGEGVYGELKYESGVHRLVRVSPFNAQSQRHTSFCLVEVLPKLPPLGEAVLVDDEIDVSFSRASGPGGQNVNKRDTAVRIVHKETDISVHVSSQRSQAQNKEKALELLRGKLFARKEEERRLKERGLSLGPATKIEWGNQIRSYVLHPYKLVKDHRTDTEVRDVESVLAGNVQPFIDAMKTAQGEE